MDWKTFFANVIGSLAWPILVGVVIYLLRDEMAALLRRMKGAKIAGTELAFDEALEKAQEGAEMSRANTLRRTSPYTFLMNGN
jgi:hypothetical protein